MTFGIDKIYSKLSVISDGCCRVTENSQRSERGLGKSAYGFILLDELDQVLTQSSTYLGEASPIFAEYTAIIAGLDKAVEFCRSEISVWTDSEKIVRQMSGEYGILTAEEKDLYDTVKRYESRFVYPVKYFHHSRGSFWARLADKLANEEYSRRQMG